MIRFKLILPAILLFTFLQSCNHHGQTIVITDGTNRTEMNRRGDIQFTADSTSIKSISEEGYLSYGKNERRFRAERNKDGSVYLEMYFDGKQISLDSSSKAFLSAGVKDMAERGIGRIRKD